eukprot:TRINITY_DN18665_c0_g1_i1.p1 TRINITY_DN18665_c0_g1~~TRINITY_DN18665_c0_g1_i1.p1  ORF type:complete len:174 (+),score=35.02 TRINITY_DN18665_c0_g1_i1:182-703(+)
MPGFILAFAEAEVLSRHGFGFWDLGGINSSPMMSYKPEVSLQLSRAEFMDLLMDTHRHARAGTLPAPKMLLPGVALAEIKEDDLWCIAACREGTAAAKKPAAKPAKPTRQKVGQTKAAGDDKGAQVYQGSAKAEPSATTSARARFQELFQELCGQGMNATEAAAEALKRLTSK